MKDCIVGVLAVWAVIWFIGRSLMLTGISPIFNDILDRVGKLLINKNESYNGGDKNER